MMFKVRKEERNIALFAAICVIGMNIMLLSYYFYPFAQLSNRGYRFLMNTFHVSGFDSFTYYVVTDWSQQYIVMRHPLMAYMLWPFYLLNKCIMSLFGFNAAIFIVSGIEAFCGFYSVLFLYRIFTDVIELKRSESAVLCLMYMSFGYVLLTFCVPEHFGISAFLLILSLYISGMKMKTGKLWTRMQSFMYFIITAGVTLSNGLKIYLSELFVNGKRFWGWKHLVLACVLPVVLLLGSVMFTENYFVKPMQGAERARHARVVQILKKKGIKPSKKRVTTGKPVSTVKFLNWTDVTTARDSSLVENFFGEPIQLHEDYLLADQWKIRPVIVKYHWWISYFVELSIVLFFLLGIWYGRKNRFMWLVLSYFVIDFFLHIILGFAINEVYIMSPHYLFAIPICIGYMLKQTDKKKAKYVGTYLALSTVFLFVWNISLFIQYFYIL